MKKLVGIFVMVLMIVTTIPVVYSADINYSIQESEGIYDDYYRGDSNRIIGTEIVRRNTNEPPPDLDIKSVPNYFNWKDFGDQDWNTPVKNQGDCGCCWLFACLGAFESTINIIEGSAVIDPDLSEQYVLSCIPAAGNCNGGGSGPAMELIMAETQQGNYHNGVPIEECFPYQADDDIPCDDKCPDWLDKLVPMLDAGYWYKDDINLMKCQIMEKGPAATDIYATTDFIEWGTTHHNPNSYYRYVEASGANHIVIIVGWKDSPLIPKGGYWICKNSWGSNWGYDGFFNIVYGSLNINQCLDWIEYDPESYEWPNEPNPPSITTITGKTNGTIRTEYEYILNSVDPEDYDLRYYISWGDGNWEWTDYYPSGEDVIIKHTYKREGDYSVATLAMNTNHNIGPWGTLKVTIPRNKASIGSVWLRFFDMFPILQRMLAIF